MKHAFLSFISFLVLTTTISNSIYSQSLEISQACIDSLLIEKPFNEKDKIIGHNLWNVYRFNKVKAALSDTDTITLINDNGSYYGQYESHRFPMDKQDWHMKEPIFLSGSKNAVWESFNAKFPDTDSDSIWTVVSVYNHNVFKDDPLMTIYSYINDVFYGEFLQRTMSGKTIKHGMYNTIDSIYKDSIVTFDYYTYKEKLIVKNRKQFSSMCGDWIEYNINGDIVNVTKNVDCKEESSSMLWYVAFGLMFLLFLFLVVRISRNPY